ncbi:Crp/Fnr family transcriptional regulator [Bradyrhizobium sp. OAE829]|uniref:Crp/Fnr family transcriptional regulator n=1 Tax=Bradyrhizobium sp. OAE829 TaxID=2663807 RepID=UPI00339A3253
MPLTDNVVLASLPAADLSLLATHLKVVAVKQHQILFEAGDPLEAVYFPLNAVVSLVVSLSTGQSVEAAMVGRDGVVSALSALDGQTAVNRGVVQLGGQVMVCSPAALKEAAKQSDTILSMISRHELALFAQAQQSAACMASHRVEARLCRWLLRARDLAGSDALPFTQEYLGEMLGVRRTSVTVVANTLQQAGLLQYRRGRIQLVNLEALEEAACECYQAVKSTYEKLLVHDHRAHRVLRPVSPLDDVAVAERPQRRGS